MPETGYGFNLQDGDWTRVRQLFQLIGSSVRLGPTSTPRFAGLTSEGDLMPATDNAYDIGETTTPLRWKNIECAGSGRFDGGIGIGAAAASDYLYIYKTGGKIGVQLDNYGAGDAIIQFALATVTKFILGVDNSDSDKFKIAVGSVLGTNTVLTLDSSGNITIGDITADTYNGLTFLTNDLRIDDAVNNNSLLVSGDCGFEDNTDGFILSGGATPRNLIVTGGDWTIDQSVASGASPTFGDISLGFGDLVSEQNPDPANAIRIKGTSSDVDVVLGSASGYFSVYNAADDTNVFNVSDRGNTVIAGDLTVDTNTLFVDAGNDKVGIGTISPDSVFHIKASVPGIIGSHHAGQLIIQNPADDVNACAVITGYESDGSGNPDQQLWYLGNSSAGNEDIIFLNRRNAKLALGTNGSSRITILGNGDVGIGTATPSERLDLDDGNLITTGILTAAGFSVDATIDHTITNSTDDLVFTNPNQDKDIIFNINDGSTQKDFMKIDASLSSLILATGSCELANIISITGTNTADGAGAGVGLRFALTQTGTVPTYALYGVATLDEDTGATSIYGARFDVVDDTAAPTNNHTKTALVLTNTPETTLAGGTHADYGFDIDIKGLMVVPASDFGVDYTQIGGKISRDAIAIYDAIGGSWNDVTTYGLYITGWGSTDVASGIDGTFTSYAIYVDGGDSVLAGNLRIGSTLAPTAALSMGDDKLIAADVNAGLTASTTQSQGQGALTAQVNEISTVANDNDTVTLPSAVTGIEIEIINNGANTLRIYPASGDDLGLGVNTAEELEANERVEFVAYDTTNWAKKSSTEIIHAEIHDEDNTDAFVINDAGGDFHSYHTNGLAAGDLADWTFDAGGAGTSFPIASIADGADSGVDIAVTTTGTHGLEVGDIISQTNLADAAYVGVFVVKAIISTTVYEVAAVYTADGTGTMDQAATLEADAVAAGVYSFAYCISGTSSTNNETVDFQLHKEATAVVGSKVRRKFGTASDFGAMSGCGVVTVASGDKISLALSNEDSAGNITLRNFTLVLIRL